MMPTLYNGDLVFFKKYYADKTKLKIGDIVIFHHPFKNIRLIKRVKTIEAYSIEVAGDNKNSSKDSKIFGFIQKEKIIGIVTSKISYKSFNDFKNLFNS
tara:strand:+ start:199 stop:495 length:297 start_codon:yes stop_codon:yes gene_type:complete